MTQSQIISVDALRVWDSRGRPTVEARVMLGDGSVGTAIAPAGASRGSREAVDLRDGGEDFGGNDVATAVAGVNQRISDVLVGLDASDQSAVDEAMLALDSTSDKHSLGGNAMVAVSMASLHAAASYTDEPLWRYLAGNDEVTLPLPEIQIFGGGAHANRRVDVQDFMVIAIGAQSFRQALDWTAETYRAAGELLAAEGRLQGVADEGGYWPVFESNEQGLAFLVKAIERAGLRPGEDMGISLDIAASEFGDARGYRLASDDLSLSGEELRSLIADWLAQYPIVSVEDPVAEDDEQGMVAFTRAHGERLQIIGDDFLVTNATHVEHAAAVGACNALLVKPNQAGTISETRAAFDAAVAAGWHNVVSARSGETEDTTIVHLATGWRAPQLKVGSFSRSERMAKWNEGLRIARDLGGDGPLPPRESFGW